MHHDHAAGAFVARWQGVSGSERANCQLFVTELCRVLGVDEPGPASEDTRDNAYVFERRVVFAHGDGSSSHGFIDCYRRGAFVLEAKKIRAGAHTRGFDDALLRARAQAEAYARAPSAACTGDRLARQPPRRQRRRAMAPGAAGAGGVQAGCRRCGGRGQSPDLGRRPAARSAEVCAGANLGGHQNHRRAPQAEEQYDSLMGIATGTVVAGRIHVEGIALPEGAVVTVLTPGGQQGVLLTPEEEAQLLEALAQADRGETMSAEELFARLERNARP